MRLLAYILLISSSLFTPLSALPTETEKNPSVEGLRIWTNRKNKNITASLVKLTKVHADKTNKKSRIDVTFKYKSGKIVTFDVKKLSKDHQTQLINWVKKNPTGIAKPSPPYSWPEYYAGKNAPKAQYIKFDESRKAHLFRTSHFDFYADERLSDSTISKCVAVFDSIVETINALPLAMDTIPSGKKPRFQALIVSSQQKYMQLGGIKNSAGFFSPGRNLTVIPMQSLGIVKKGNNWVFDGKKRSFKTLVHELTHHATSHWYGMPPWFEEGLADYMEAMPYQSGRFLFSNTGSAISKSIRKYKKTTVEKFVYPKGLFKMRHLKILFNTSRQQWNASMASPQISSRNYSSSMVLMYYLMHVDGRGDGHHLIQWMHKHKAAYISRRIADLDGIFKKHILRDRTYEDIEKEIKTSMSKKGTRLDFSP